MVVSIAPGTNEVCLSGTLDVSTVHDVRLAVHAAVDDGAGDLFVDLRDVEMLDATGLGMLVGAHRRAGRAGRRLVLRNAALNIYADTQDEKFYPPETLSRMVSAGDLGRKSGQGFYTYDER